MKYVKHMMLVGFLGAACGCFNHKAVVGAGGNEDGEAAYSQWESHWLFGTIGESEVDIKELCPSGNATVLDEVSFLNGLVGMFTAIVWYPSTVEVYCDGGGAAPAEEGHNDDAVKVGTVTLTREQALKVALHPRTMQWAQRVAPMKAAELRIAIAAYHMQTKHIAASGHDVSGL